MKLLYVFALSIILTTAYAHEPVRFFENKGQLYDEAERARPDILYYGRSGPLQFFIKRSGFSYQLVKKLSGDSKRELIKKAQLPPPSSYQLNRVDVEWVNAQLSAGAEAFSPSQDYYNFYGPACPDGALGVRTYEEVRLQEVYRGIDVRFYREGDILKYDFLVEAGADHRQIIFAYSGHSSLRINKAGELEITTPSGRITESEPVVKQGSRDLRARWRTEGDRAWIEIENRDMSQALLIDPPIRSWGTYLGGSDDDQFRGLTYHIDKVYSCGLSNSISNIATSGAHQTVLNGTLDDGILTCFHRGGQRMWTTYYGGSGIDDMTDCEAHGLGIAVSGITTSTNAIATSGSHQPAKNGPVAAFVAHFDHTGARLWGSYLNGNSVELGWACATGNNGTIFLCGTATSTTGIASPGSHQPALSGNFSDGFIASFNAFGQLNWSTYFGGPEDEHITACDVDESGQLVIAGSTSSTLGLASAASQHTVFGGGAFDAFVARFSSAGVQLWSTYHGGVGDELFSDVFADIDNNIFMAGTTTSGNGIDKGGFQPMHGGLNDAFLAVYDSLGNWLYGTFYGGAGNEEGQGITMDYNTGDFIMCGNTDSQGGTVIATTDAYQPNFGGGPADGFIVAFDYVTAMRKWGTYYGGAGMESADACAENVSDLFVAGRVGPGSNSVVATEGALQTNYGGGNFDGFLTRFHHCSGPAYLNPPSEQTVCVGSAISLSVSGTGTISWYASATSTLAVGNGSIFTTPAFSAGSYMLFAEHGGCNGARSPISFAVDPCTSVSEFYSEKLSVYPNPAGQQLNVELAERGRIQIFNSLSQQMLEQDLEAGSHELSLHDYAPGFYMIRFESEGARHSIKVLKQ